MNGVNFAGPTGFFKFALVDAAGTTTRWSNDGTSVGGGEPTDGVPVTVSNGHYAVPLGDPAFHANMNNNAQRDRQMIDLQIIAGKRILPSVVRLTD